MKVCIAQPHYSVNWEDSQNLFEWEIEAMDSCDDSMDLIVFPESCDVPAYAKTYDQFINSYTKKNGKLFKIAGFYRLFILVLID